MSDAAAWSLLGIFTIGGCGPAADDTGTTGTTSDGGSSDGRSSDGGSSDGGDEHFAPGDLFINELMPENHTTVTDDLGAWPDWLELYNPGDVDLSLAGWTVSDELAQPDKHALDDSLVVPAGGWLLLWADDEAAVGPTHLGFQLSSDGDALGIYAPAGNRVDAVEFGPLGSDVSAARVPDGSLTWVLSDPATPGVSNGAAVAAGTATIRANTNGSASLR